MATRKNVPAAAVRAWFAANTPAGVPAPGSRGRLHPDTIAAFHKANPRSKYETASEAEVPSYEVAVVTLDKNGRKTTVKRNITNVAARTLLGQVSKNAKGEDVLTRGRMNHGLLSEALSAVEADKFADQFSK